MTAQAVAPTGIISVNVSALDEVSSQVALARRAFEAVMDLKTAVDARLTDVLDLDIPSGVASLAANLTPLAAVVNMLVAIAAVKLGEDFFPLSPPKLAEVIQLRPPRAS